MSTEDTPRQLTIQIGAERFGAQALDADCADELIGKLPLSGTLIQEQWSGAIISSLDAVAPMPPSNAAASTYQYPSLVSLCARTGRLTICYGQGRLQDAAAPLPTVPLARIAAPVEQLAAVCKRVQFDGETPFAITEANADGRLDTTPPRTQLRLTLGDSYADAVLEPGSPTAERLLSALPARGVATNTHTSGPLVRFWNGDGGDEGRTPLPLTDDELASAQSLLTPGQIYYLPKPDVAGLRITTRSPAIMRPALGGQPLKLVPIARLVGPWERFADTAAGLQRSGAVEMTIEHDDQAPR